jgi:hypothetical protein
VESTELDEYKGKVTSVLEGGSARAFRFKSRLYAEGPVYRFRQRQDDFELARFERRYGGHRIIERYAEAAGRKTIGAEAAQHDAGNGCERV